MSAEDSEQYESLTEHWWRFAFVVAALAVAFFADEPWIALFGTIPILLWCTGPVRSPRNGVVVGSILLALLVWFMASGRLGWSGRWVVPSVDEAILLHTVLATLGYGFGSPASRRVDGFLPLVLMLPAAILLTGWVLMQRTESVSPPDEGVRLVPAGLEVVQDNPECGSGGCQRLVTVAGANAAEVVRAHLADQGFTSESPQRMCRVTGLVVPFEACVYMRPVNTDTIRVSLHVE